MFLIFSYYVIVNSQDGAFLPLIEFNGLVSPSPLAIIPTVSKFIGIIIPNLIIAFGTTLNVIGTTAEVVIVIFLNTA
jgi:hypothetical protein